MFELDYNIHILPRTFNTSSKTGKNTYYTSIVFVMVKIPALLYVYFKYKRVEKV